MLNELRIMNSNGDSLSLPIPRGSDGYLVTEIEGLGPVPVALASSPYSKLPGESFHGARKEKRNVVLRIRLQKSYWTTSVDERRQRLHRFFSPEGHLNLYFSTSQFGEVFLRGWVESVDQSMFTDDPVYVVSIVCFDPLFESLHPTRIIGSIPRTVEFDYRGTERGAIDMRVWFGSSGSTFDSLLIQNDFPTGDYQRMSLNVNLPPFAILRVNTARGRRTVELHEYNMRPLDDNGDLISGAQLVEVKPILHARTNDSDWLELWPGTNTFSITPYGGSSPTVRFDVTFYEYFGGI